MHSSLLYGVLSGGRIWPAYRRLRALRLHKAAMSAFLPYRAFSLESAPGYQLPNGLRPRTVRSLVLC